MIGIHQVASVSVASGLIFGDVIIETTGGSQPIRCHGHLRGDAEEIRRRITGSQTAQPRFHSQPQTSTDELAQEDPRMSFLRSRRAF
jgi:hypothetical protein